MKVKLKSTGSPKNTPKKLEAWCSYDCPYFISDITNSYGAYCNFLDVELDYYDGFLAACEMNPQELINVD